MAKPIKKRLTQQQEFDIMKLVLDKFLWLGTAIMAFGLLNMWVEGIAGIKSALLIMVAGAVVFVLFLVMVVKEYEIIK